MRAAAPETGGPVQGLAVRSSQSPWRELWQVVKPQLGLISVGHTGASPHSTAGRCSDLPLKCRTGVNLMEKLEVGSSPNHLEIAEALSQRRKRLEHPHMGLSHNVLAVVWSPTDHKTSALRTGHCQAPPHHKGGGRRGSALPTTFR